MRHTRLRYVVYGYFTVNWSKKRGGGDGGLRLSKMVYVWQNAHISKNRKEAEQKIIYSNKQICFDFMAPKT